MEWSKLFLVLTFSGGLVVMLEAQEKDPVRYFSQNKCFCSESSLFCCLLIYNDGNPKFATFLYGNTSAVHVGTPAEIPEADTVLDSENPAQVDADIQPVRISTLDLPDLLDSNGSGNLTDPEEIDQDGSLTVASDSSTSTTPPSAGTALEDDEAVQEETNRGTVDSDVFGGSTPPVHLGFVGCGQDVCLPKNGLQESEKGCGYYLNCWNYCGWTQKCPDLLVFNMEKQWCDWSWRLPSNHVCYAAWPGRAFNRTRARTSTERPTEETDSLLIPSTRD